MDWKPIPSLSALRAFEAAARLNTFSAAAKELNVTHAAISQHVRHLEAHFGKTLLFRQGQKMALTEAGMHLAKSLSDGFGAIASGVSALLADVAQQPLKVSLTPAFAENWLMPRLGGFWAHHPEIEIALYPSPALVDLKRDGFDLAIRFGNGDWPGLTVSRLASACYIVVAAPRLIGNRKPSAPRDLKDLPWLVESQYQEQSLLAADFGLDVSPDKFTDMATSGLLLSAARAGHGVAIVSEALVERDIADGSLVKLFETFACGRDYYIVTLKDAPSKKLRLFQKWLKTQSETTA